MSINQYSIQHLNKGLGYQLKITQQLLRKKLDSALSDIGVTAAQYGILNAIQVDPDASNADLARTAFVTRQSIQDILTNLVKNGLISQEPGSKGRHVVSNILTRKGEKVVSLAHIRAIKIEQTMLLGFTGDDVLTLKTLLEKFSENLCRS